MKDKIWNMVKKHWFLIGVIAMAVIKQLLVVGLPIFAIPGAACDDQLMKNWAFSMAKLEWTGEFNAYTFMKEPGFSFFLALCFRLHLPFIFTITLGYSIASVIFATSLNKIFSSKVFVFFIYVVILFNPLAYSLPTLQRVYRNGFGMILTLLVFGGLIHLYFSILEEKQWKPVVWAVLTGLSLGYLWITKSDTIWVMPFVAVVCVVMLGMLLMKRRNLKSIPRYLCLTFPFLGIFLFSHGVEFCNVAWYGYPSVEYYGAALNDLTHIKSEDGDEKISLTRAQLKELYRISPTLASVQEELEDAMEKNSEYDTRPKDGEVEDGWIGWALIEGFSDAGVYEDCGTANVFYKKVYEELEAAFADGRLEKEETTTAQNYYIDTPEHRKKLAARTMKAVKYMTTYKKAHARVVSSGEQGVGTRDFEQLTRNNVICDEQKHDYTITGWIVFPEYRWKELSVYVEDEEGNQYKEMKFKGSKDVYEYLQGTKYETKAAKKCRFRTSWDVEEGEEKTSWYLAVYQGEKLLDRIEMLQSGFDEDADIFYTGSLDTYIYQKEGDIVIASAKAVAKRLNRIGDVYRALGQPVFWIGLVSYVVLTAAFIVDLFKKRYDKVNAWLLATGFGLSVIVFAVGIAVVDLTQCPAINEMYLSAAYAILMGAELISILKCVEMVLERIRRKKAGSFSDKEEQNGF